MHRRLLRAPARLDPVKPTSAAFGRARKRIFRAIDYNAQIAAPIAHFLRKGGLIESVLYIVTTLGVPLRITSESGSAWTGTARRSIAN